MLGHAGVQGWGEIEAPLVALCLGRTFGTFHSDLNPHYKIWRRGRHLPTTGGTGNHTRVLSKGVYSQRGEGEVGKVQGSCAWEVGVIWAPVDAAVA